MPRPIWSGAISFGLVNVPVKLVTAPQPKDVRFHQLHRRGWRRGSNRSGCARSTATRCHYDHIVKGYDLGGDRYVVIEPEELAHDRPEGHPDHRHRGVRRPRRDRPDLLRALLLPGARRAGREGVRLAGGGHVQDGQGGLARFVLRTKQYLAALRAKDGVLVLSTMLFADEVVDTARPLDVPHDRATRRAVPTGSWPWPSQLVESPVDRVRPGQVPRRVPPAGARPDRAQGGQESRRRPASPAPVSTMAPSSQPGRRPRRQGGKGGGSGGRSPDGGARGQRQSGRRERNGRAAGAATSGRRRGRWR